MLADPVRRQLYRFVVAQDAPVSRDAAAEGAGVARHTAKFHLDRLVEQGLLEPVFRRLSDRRGPGAGRPTKHYRRSARQLSVTVPQRDYELAARLMAQAIDDATAHGLPVETTLDAVAAAAGARMAVPDASTTAAADAGVMAAAYETLRRSGYEPRRAGAVITLANCPFDALVRDHTALVCGMNRALVNGLCRALADAAGTTAEGEPQARLDPAAGRCCVVLTTD
jgi:predicted ArsR family transcriptional regulator